MNTINFDNWMDMNRSALAPLTKWNEIATETAQKLVQHQMNVVQNCMDIGTRQVQLLGELKDPQKFGAEVTKLASDVGQKMVERSGDYFKIVRETQEAVVQWTETFVKPPLGESKP